MEMIIAGIALLAVIALGIAYAVAREKNSELTFKNAKLETIVNEYTELQIIMIEKLEEKNEEIRNLERYVLENSTIDELADVLNSLHKDEEGNGSDSGSMPN